MNDDRAWSIGRRPYGLWFFRVLAWDSLLPCFIIGVPYVIEAVFPGKRGIMEITSVILPIVGFFVRVTAGKRHIFTNNCNKWMRRFQFFLFCIGILMLLLFDAFLILTHIMPQGPVLESTNDFMVAGIFLGFYLSLMIVAMYPGRNTDCPKR
jgi:hypothetical protein